MKLLVLQNTGGFYGTTNVVLATEAMAIKVEGALKKMESAPGFISGGEGVSWQIVPINDQGVAVYKTGGQNREAEVLKALGI